MVEIIARLLTLLMHTLLRRDGIRRLLGHLLLLEVGLVLHGLLLVGGRHVRLRGSLGAHVLLGHGGRGGDVLFFGGVDGGFAVYAVGVCWLGRVQACLGGGQWEGW